MGQTDSKDQAQENNPAANAKGAGDHSLCVIGKGQLPSNFPLDTFVKNEAKCKLNKTINMRECSFKYNPEDFKNGRSGGKTTWNNSYILYVIMAAILVVSLGLFAFYNFKIRKGRAGRAGGKASAKGRSLKTKSKRSPGSKKATSTISGGKKSSRVSSKKSGKSSMKASSKKSSSKK